MENDRYQKNEHNKDLYISSLDAEMNVSKVYNEASEDVINQIPKSQMLCAADNLNDDTRWKLSRGDTQSNIYEIDDACNMTDEKSADENTADEDTADEDTEDEDTTDEDTTDEDTADDDGCSDDGNAEQVDGWRISTGI